VELIVVMTILSVISAAAISIFSDGFGRARNAQRDADVRSIISSARAMKINEGRYPVNSVDFHDNAIVYISNMVKDPESPGDITKLGQPLTTNTEQEYTYAYWDPPQEYTDERVSASTHFVTDESDAEQYNSSFGRYKVGTMHGPDSEIEWTLGYSYSTNGTNPGTILTIATP